MVSNKEKLYRHSFQICYRYAIRRVLVNHDDLKLNGAKQRLVYADGVNILGRSVHTTGKTQTL